MTTSTLEGEAALILHCKGVSMELSDYVRSLAKQGEVVMGALDFLITGV